MSSSSPSDVSSFTDPSAIGGFLLPIFSLPPIIQALLGTLFTWFVTALGAAVIFLLPANLSPSSHRILLDSSLGFAAGVMLAASFWSLLAPAIEAAEAANYGIWAFLPSAIGFMAGAAFMVVAGQLLPEGAEDASRVEGDKRQKRKTSDETVSQVESALRHIDSDDENGHSDTFNGQISRRGPKTKSISTSSSAMSSSSPSSSTSAVGSVAWRRLMLLVIAVTIHNLPEGLAVGVSFAASSTPTTFYQSVSLSIGIGLQNFPEGLAVSLPLMRLGYSPIRAFFYGQLSGMVEPIAALLGVVLLRYMGPLLPYALAWAAGAMVWVVLEDLVPETGKIVKKVEDGKIVEEIQMSRVALIGCMIGFVIMMTLDVTLG